MKASFIGKRLQVIDTILSVVNSGNQFSALEGVSNAEMRY
ncbi:hypothetical protein PMIT1320_00543 [Prochlorococcus marinus str. MIT 1320]|nr:hypothetical protein PMIT1320_00543 [Prochlorococcus marinus str. MIT 1320]